MWSTLKISSGAQLGHDKRDDIPAFDTVLFHSNLSSLRRKYIGDVPTDKIVLSSVAKTSKRLLKRGHWWLKNKEGKCHFRFVERRFLAALNFTGSAEGALVPVLLRITHWTKWSNLSQQHPTRRTCCNRVAKCTQHVAPNNVAMCCVGMLRSFGRGFRTFRFEYE